MFSSKFFGDTMFYFIFLVSVSLLVAQSESEIRDSGHYYWGQGVSENQREARDFALNELAQSISVTVQSAFSQQVQESESAIQKKTESVLKSYSLATLKNLNAINTPTDEGIRVFLYIRKSDVAQIFEARKKLVHTLFRNAGQYARQGNAADALKWYYFAVLLMNSIPEQTIVDEGVNLTIEIPRAIKQLINDIQFSVVDDQMLSKTERVINLRMRAGNQELTQLAFRFWDGSQQVNVHGKDGIATVRLYGSAVQLSELSAQITYSFYQNRNEIAAVGTIWNAVRRPTFPHQKKIRLNVSNARTQTAQQRQQQTQATEIANAVPAVQATYMTFLKAMQSGSLNLLPAGVRKQVQALRKRNKTRIIDTRDASFNRTADGYEIRGIRVQNDYPTLRKQQTETLNLDFNQQGELTHVSFSVFKKLHEQYVDGAKTDRERNERQIIVKFLERYRTAYMTRDLATIKQIFSNDALIIVGKKLKKTTFSEVGYNPVGKQPDIEYVKLSKAQYIDRLEKTFQAQSDIYLNFSTFKIRTKNNQAGVYGVSMRQNYYSSTYSDEGHLFLLIDFNDSLPKIYVRSWQPQEWDEQTLIGLSNFKIHK